MIDGLANRCLKPLSHISITGGSGGIRTHGTLRYDGFQDRCLKPLSHTSKNKKPELVRFGFCIETIRLH